MPKRLHRHFTWIGIAIYLLALLIVSIVFHEQALKPLWMAWGVGVVLFFFLLTYVFNQRWQHDDRKLFLKKVFWVALGVRLVYVGAIIYYYYLQTGISLEYQAADSLNYHRWAICADAVAKGKEEGIRVYQFLREPLEFLYCKEFWEMLDAAARHILG